MLFTILYFSHKIVHIVLLSYSENGSGGRRGATGRLRKCLFFVARAAFMMCDYIVAPFKGKMMG